MRPEFWKLFFMTLCLVLSLAACSMEPGGSEEPAGFSAELTPAQPADGAIADATAEAEAAVPAQPGKLEAMEESLQAAVARIGALENSMHSLQQSMAAIEMTASQALIKAKEGPLAGMDLSDETAAGKALMEQSLEQIIGISKLLLEKMEGRLNESSPEATEVPEAPATEVQ